MTFSVGRSIGSVIDLRALLNSDISTVQTLRPRNKSQNYFNRYSGTYGLEEFPLHTDLAHWEVPPRYMLLRCKKGSYNVHTKLFDSTKLLPIVTSRVLRRALVRARRPAKNQVLTLLPVLFEINSKMAIRWDSLFLVPMNEEAHWLSQLIDKHTSKIVETLILANQGDTLIVDNWRILHGRSRVSQIDVNRRIERIYLSEVSL